LRRVGRDTSVTLRRPEPNLSVSSAAGARSSSTDVAHIRAGVHDRDLPRFGGRVQFGVRQHRLYEQPVARAWSDSARESPGNASSATAIDRPFTPDKLARATCRDSSALHHLRSDRVAVALGDAFLKASKATRPLRVSRESSVVCPRPVGAGVPSVIHYWGTLKTLQDDVAATSRCREVWNCPDGLTRFAILRINKAVYGEPDVSVSLLPRWQSARCRCDDQGREAIRFHVRHAWNGGTRPIAPRRVISRTHTSPIRCPDPSDPGRGGPAA
jgi:hypothetical protein